LFAFQYLALNIYIIKEPKSQARPTTAYFNYNTGFMEYLLSYLQSLSAISCD
jgi:hypothetical protein